MGTFTIFFDGQFWVGVLTRDGENGSEIARVVFGPEPTDAELAVWIREAYGRLAFVPTNMEAPAPLHRNPKRRMREARRALEEPRTRTRAQEAWSIAMEATKAALVTKQRELRRDAADARYALRVAKRKRKHRSR
ncbi:MAG: YjdF family protein [Polyangiaceae bacterium]